MNHSLRHRALSLLILAALSACSDSGSPASMDATGDAGVGAQDANEPHASHDAGPTATSVTLRFSPVVGSQPFNCSGHFEGMGTNDAHVSPLDFRIYVHNVRLVTDTGTEVPFALEQDGLWQHRNLALLDFEDKTGSCANGTAETHMSLQGTAPAGTYTGVRFTVGVPFELNHGDVATAPSPLNLSGLFWSWSDGYKFAKMDAKVMNHATETVSSFLVHLGSTGCAKDGQGKVTACANPNRGEVSLSGFDPTTKSIVVDYGALFSGSELTSDKGGAPGCMSGATDPECAPLLQRFGINPANGQGDASKQALFRAP